ncbi:hypothetical protein K2173_007303 [Erythroxylum novogranatense]|uniref:SHSP domain-containing protein n=1 Tax=Erythroxylum novogranatense TaxID=1862640 RepID=A0AAV8T7F9_9ROSI|nr:hypothetical protein K2173_007303 [Erythroxylum novogranatense]
MDVGSKLKPSVVLTGTASEGTAGPPIGLVDTGISKDAYLFRIALPGIRRNESKLSCDVKVDGTVNIKGQVVHDGGILKNSSREFQMKVQQLCPPGPFSISFKLPGPVDPRLFFAQFRDDGILEAVVYKSKLPTVDGNLPPS